MPSPLALTGGWRSGHGPGFKHAQRLEAVDAVGSAGSWEKAGLAAGAGGPSGAARGCGVGHPGRCPLDASPLDCGVKGRSCAGIPRLMPQVHGLPRAPLLRAAAARSLRHGPQPAAGGTLPLRSPTRVPSQRQTLRGPRSLAVPLSKDPAASRLRKAARRAPSRPMRESCLAGRRRRSREIPGSLGRRRPSLATRLSCGRPRPGSRAARWIAGLAGPPRPCNPPPAAESKPPFRSVASQFIGSRLSRRLRPRSPKRPLAAPRWRIHPGRTFQARRPVQAIPSPLEEHRVPAARRRPAGRAVDHSRQTTCSGRPALARVASSASGPAP